MCVVATAVWCRLSDSNRRPTAYKAVALPTELSRRAAFFASNDAEGPALDAGERVGQRGGGPGRRLARDRAQPCGGQQRVARMVADRPRQARQPIGRAHVRTPVTNANIVSRTLLETK